jgi:hypothetical protein
MNLVNFTGTHCISRHRAPGIQKKEKVLIGAGGDASWGVALEHGAAVADTLGLFILPTGRPGRHFTDADDEATSEASFGIFLLSRGWPRPRFSISTPVPRLKSPASAIGKLRSVERKNPRWDMTEEDDAAEEADNERIRVFPEGLVYFIYT